MHAIAKRGEDELFWGWICTGFALIWNTSRILTPADFLQIH
jgi:hypothetical protein